VELPQDFSEFFALLDANHAEYLVVGAYALAVHGAPRFTGDIDILIRPTRENAERVLEAIRAFGFPTDSISADRLQRPEALVEMGLPPLQIHVMSEISGVSWEAAWSGRSEVSLRDRHLNVIGRAELVANKRAAGRPKDLADLDALGEGAAES